MDVQTRRAIPFEEADTATLRQALSHYANPDNKIGDLVRRGEILRVHKGLYAIAPEFRQAPLSLEILANRIYGPSYLSLEYALSWYSMIPERVTELTSVCLGRSRSFSTAVGVFSYVGIKREAYSEGFDRIDLPKGRTFLMATRKGAGGCHRGTKKRCAAFAQGYGETPRRGSAYRRVRAPRTGPRAGWALRRVVWDGKDKPVGRFPEVPAKERAG